MSEKILASVIVPIYKVEEYLRECVDSILAQTYSNLQVILVDDGSPDGCGAICDEYKEKDPRVEVIHKPNGGLGSARNAGLDAAKGKYVYFVDSDDFIHTNEVEVTLAEMEKGGWDLCAFGAVVYENGQEGAPIGRVARTEFHMETEEERCKFLCRFFLKGRVRWEAWSRVFRREIIEKNGLRFGDERKIFAEDMDFCYRYLMYCRNMVCVPDNLYAYRMRGSSIMHTKKWEEKCRQLANMLYVQKESVGAMIPLGKSYLYEAVIISEFMNSSKRELGIVEKAKLLRQAFMTTERWEFVRQEAALAAGDRQTMVNACGGSFGTFIWATMRYLADGNEKTYSPYAQRYMTGRLCYEKVREMKNVVVRLLRRG